MVSLYPATESEAGNEFWADRKKSFESRTPQQKIYSKLLQLKFQLDDFRSILSILNFPF